MTITPIHYHLLSRICRSLFGGGHRFTVHIGHNICILFAIVFAEAQTHTQVNSIWNKCIVILGQKAIAEFQKSVHYLSVTSKFFSRQASKKSAIDYDLLSHPCHYCPQLLSKSAPPPLRKVPFDLCDFLCLPTLTHIYTHIEVDCIPFANCGRS